MRFLRTIAPLLLAGAPVEISLHAQSFDQTCSSPLFPQTGQTAMDRANCAVEGSGGKETNQNKAKNNFCPAADVAPIGIEDMIALQGKVQADKSINFGNSDEHPFTDTEGPLEDRTAVQTLGEGNEVQLQGFVLKARQEGAESVNCAKKVPNQDSFHDIHISIVPSPEAAECSGVVVEMTPHHRPAAWTPENVDAVASKQLPVRVTGQLMFDSSHSPCSDGAPVKGDPSRASLWEVHPIYKFEVCPSGTCDSGGWQTLEDWVSGGGPSRPVGQR
jgi:hypothetical protein